MPNNPCEELCDCGKPATWVYMPGHENSSNLYCDDCVPRGCSCNQEHTDYKHSLDLPSNSKKYKWIDKEEGIWEPVDDQGRLYPCCEFWEI